MPFVIEVKRPDALDAAHHRLGLATEQSVRVVSRRAVGTLEGARAAVLRSLDGVAHVGNFFVEAMQLSESGGVIDLPDGGRIEVRWEEDDE